MIQNSDTKWTYQPSPQQPYARSYDAQFLPYDPEERIPISRYHANVQDDVRRGYIMKGPCQPFEHTFPTTNIKGKKSALQLCLVSTIQVARI
jgi:hypothetical protein